MGPGQIASFLNSKPSKRCLPVTKNTVVQDKMARKGRAFSAMIRVSKKVALPPMEQRLDEIAELLRVLVQLVGQRVRNIDSNAFSLLISVVRI